MKEFLKIGFDISQTGKNKAGCGFFAKEMITYLTNIDDKNFYYLYSTFGDHFWDKTRDVIAIQKTNVNYALEHTDFETAKRFWSNFTPENEMQLGDVDIIHSNNFYCPTQLTKAKLIYTLYDLSFLSHPEFTTESNRISCFYGTLYASMYADRIIAISEFSKKHFLEVFSYYSAEKIDVIYPASRFNYNQTEINPSNKLIKLVKDSFWLNVGTLEPRKNQKQILYAYADLKKKNLSLMPLVFAGGAGWMMEDFNKTIHELNLEEDVIQLGYVNDAELQWLYKNCFCLLYPSFFEGFGLPVLEAMSLGSAVITSESSSLPEIVGDTNIKIDPDNKKQLVEAMQHLVEDENYRLKLKEASLERAKLFSWENSAKKLLNIYNAL